MESNWGRWNAEWLSLRLVKRVKVSISGSAQELLLLMNVVQNHLKVEQFCRPPCIDKARRKEKKNNDS